MADQAVCIGPAAATDSYLRIPTRSPPRRRQAARPSTRDSASSSENPAFVRACTENDLVFIGPPAEVMEKTGDKARAKAETRRGPGARPRRARRRRRSRRASSTTPGSRGSSPSRWTGSPRSRRGASGSPPRSTTSASTTGSRRRRRGGTGRRPADHARPRPARGAGRAAGLGLGAGRALRRRAARRTTRTAGCCCGRHVTSTPSGGSTLQVRVRDRVGGLRAVTATRSPPPSPARPTACPGSVAPPTTPAT